MQGSLINNLMGNSRQVTPEVGMGVTFLHWTDRSAGTIVEVVNDRKIIVKADRAIRTDKNGMSECQDYIFEVATDSEEIVITKRKNGQWKVFKQGTPVSIGHRSHYHDFSF